MAKLINDSKEADPVTSQTFLATLNKKDGKGELLYPDGIEVGIEQVFGSSDGEYGGKKQTTMIIKCSILGDLDNGILARKIDEKGNVIKQVDDLGKNAPVLTTLQEQDDGANSVTFFMKVKRNDKAKGKEDGTIIVYPKSSCFSLFNCALIANGDLENPENKAFEVDTAELKEALVHFEFVAKKPEIGEFQGNTYFKLVAEASD